MTVPDLKETGAKLLVIDKALVRMLARRMLLTQDVSTWKQLHDDPIYRSQVEDNRINGVRSVAAEEGINPHFAAQLLYNIIGESCKAQMILVQGEDTRHLDLEDPEKRSDVLQQNLIELTKAVTDNAGKSGSVVHPATAMYLRFEDEHIAERVAELEKRPGWDKSTATALDLGCGEGRVSRMLAPNFGEVIGYDVSQYMVTSAASQSSSDSGEFHNVSFQQHDLRDGIPHEDQSVDLVVAGLGTASDIPDGQAFVDEVRRVLKPDGLFVLSFYNRDALIYYPGFVSIDPSLRAEINTDEDWLTVYASGETGEESVGTEPTFVQGIYYSIYARAYTLDELEKMVAKMHKTIQLSFPVMACVIPRTTLVESEDLLARVEQLDRSLTTDNTGAYWLVCGQRD